MLLGRTLATLPVVFFLATSASAADKTFEPAAPVKVVVTVEGQGKRAPSEVKPDDVMVFLDNQRMRVLDWTPIQSRQAGIELWLLIDDGTDTALGTQFEDLRKFVLEQPSTTEVGIGYLRNGSVQVVQKPTLDHAAAAKTIRLPLGMPGISASPYLALTDLIHTLPSTEHTREVVMISSGIDPDYGPGPLNPYLERAIEKAQRAGVIAHTIYFGSAGRIGHSLPQIDWGQNNLSKLAEETGGEFFWQGTSNPVSLTPYFNQLNERFQNQYALTFLPQGKTGRLRLRLATEIAHTNLIGPSNVTVGK